MQKTWAFPFYIYMVILLSSFTGSTIDLLLHYSLDGWCHCIRELEPYFMQLTAIHIYREHNTMVDSLSKEALTLAPGQLQFSEFTMGECIDQGSFSLF